MECQSISIGLKYYLLRVGGENTSFVLITNNKELLEFPSVVNETSFSGNG